MSLPDVVFDAAEVAARKLLYEVVLKSVMSKIVTAIPFFGLPFIYPILNFVFFKVADKIFNELADMGMLFKIDFKTEAQADAYIKATNELKEVLKLPDNGENNAEIERRKEEYKKRLRDLINMRNP